MFLEIGKGCDGVRLITDRKDRFLGEKSDNPEKILLVNFLPGWYRKKERKREREKRERKTEIEERS